MVDLQWYDTGILGVRAKLDRAQELLEQPYGEMDAYRDSGPVLLRPDQVSPTTLTLCIGPNDPHDEYGGTFWSLYDGVTSVVHALLSMVETGVPSHPPY